MFLREPLFDEAHEGGFFHFAPVLGDIQWIVGHCLGSSKGGVECCVVSALFFFYSRASCAHVGRTITRFTPESDMRGRQPRPY
jgi:hypothetical protein